MSMTSPYSLQVARIFRVVFIFSIILISACGREESSEDQCCNSGPLPQGIDIKSGQGALQVEGNTSVNFYVFDKSEKQISYQTLNETLALDPGEYSVKVNSSSHPVVITEGMLTKCSTGTLLVKGSTSENYYVLDSARQQLTYEVLGKATSFFISPLLVKVNGSIVTTEVKLKEVTEIQTGTLTVRGNTGENYYVLDGTGTQLNYNTLEKPLAFFQGSYAVKVNSSLIHTTVAAGQLSELTTGTLLVKGLTDENYYVLDSLGTQLNYQSLNKPLAFFPGNYRIKVNNSFTNGKVVQAQTAEYATGSLVVPGKGEENYYVLDASGNQLNYNACNKPLSFFPAEYSVRLGQVTNKATVTAGQQTTANIK